MRREDKFSDPESRAMAEETGTVVKAIDMANDMATACMGFATAAVEQFQMEKDMAGAFRVALLKLLE